MNKHQAIAAGLLADYCEGHESLAGNSMGESNYCNGNCLYGEALAEALHEVRGMINE